MMESIETEVLIVGSGMAGSSAALAAIQFGVRVLIACASRVEEAHSWSSGGMNGVLGETANWEDHAAATIAGSDFLADQDAVEIFAREASPAISEAMRLGVDCDVSLFGKGRRSYKTPSLTAGRVLEVLWLEIHKSPMIKVLENATLVELVRNDDGRIIGALFVQAPQLNFVVVWSGTVILATGGASGIFSTSTNPTTPTGQAMVLAYHAGCELMDLEMTQFHPTTLRDGSVVSEVFRTMGAQLLNRSGHRFMLAAAPIEAERATRDLVASAIAMEVRDGRGTDDGYVLLDLSPVSPTARKSPAVNELRRMCYRILGADPLDGPIPVRPASHYSMGGILVDVDGRTAAPGLFAAGEVACVSVHGANRLGANALVEARVFGRRAGLHAAMEVNSAPDLSSPPLRSRGEARVSATMSSIINGRSNSSLKAQMAMDASLFPNRDREGLMSALNRLSSFEYANAEPLTNSDRLLHELCKLTTQSALFRRESRGAHIRSDYPAKSSGLPVHTVARLGEDGEGHISSRPVRVTRWPIYGPRVRGEAGSWVAEARSPDESRSQQWMKR